MSLNEKRHSDFEKILQMFIKRYGRDRGEQYYHAWLRKIGLDENKPYNAQAKEAFRWAQPRLALLKTDENAKYYGVEALFPIESMNRNIYTEEELIRSARTLIGKPVNLNHEKPIEGVEIIDAEYEDGAVECILKVTNTEIQRMIDNEQILHVSIEANFREAETLNGIAPKGLNFTGLALLTKDVLPGVPLTRITPIEKIIEDFDKLMLKEVEKEMSEKIGEQQRICDLCGRPLSDSIDLGQFHVHPQCAQRFWLIVSKIFHFSERAVSPHETPKAPDEREWNAEAAEQRVRKWASSDGSGDKEKIDWGKYRQAFAWYNAEDPENFGSYKLPHHDIIDGRLSVVWHGVAAAMAALMGARGGVDIPPADRRAVYMHLKRHYDQFEKEPPELEAVQETIERILAETIEEQKQTIQKLVSEKRELEEKLKAAKRQSRVILRL
ncbi:MAG: hypothetical protein QXZ06_06240 [Candidatus Jordarchaeales archaeon]